jgi:hypothetical protein
MSDAIHAFWRRLDQPGHDAARLARAGEGWLLEGYAAFRENGPTGLRYAVSLASDFATTGASVVGHRNGRPIRHEFRRADGEWRLDHEIVPGLRDLIHLDFGFTPATNLQQLLYADLMVGEDAEIPAAWFDVGKATLTRLPQHYRRTAPDRYDYSSPTAGYEATLEMAASGFVRLYPGLWEMEPEA